MPLDPKVQEAVEKRLIELNYKTGSTIPQIAQAYSLMSIAESLIIISEAVRGV